jgi:oxygen-dependent protoporphyrinogen oxidase
VSVVIVGAGITGLAAAFELAKQQIPIVVVEASARAGGLIRTDYVDGFTIERGPDSLLAQKPAGIQLCEELGLGPALMSSTPPRHAFVLHEGQLHRLPSPSILGIPTTWKALAGYDLLPWHARLRLGLEALMRPRRESEDESVASFFRRRFGPGTVPLIAAPLLGGIHAGDVEALSIRSLFPRLVEAESRRGSVVLSFRRTRPAGSGEGAFRSLAAGMGELVTAIERRLPPGAIHYSSPVSALERTGSGWSVRAGDRSFEGRAVILAVPAFVAASLLSALDAEASSLCSQVPYVSTASIALAWPRDQVRHDLRGSGFVVARTPGAPRITACTWVSSKWRGRAPAGHVLLRAFIGGATDPDAAALPDDELIAIATRELSAALGMSTAPELARVYRWPRAGAQHNVGHLERIARLEARLANLAGLFVAGSGFRSIGIPDCIADGRAAAAAAAMVDNRSVSP